ncbi:MAG: methyltransferase domain-containing protein [Mesorhizobium sp.]|uniref:methyltransferase domain-containing protein n=1 Tax=Mesorhizobium sp. TaxID=1871066 RepID=UPI001AD08C71|nr:methyltransferase domain-containing protein [Mesorhizobium sp.]MBN9220968.1 methyltransferase domain-containing protein [Mesorhizobium sp.]
MIKDKRSLLANISDKADTYLELGCGNRKRHPEAIGIDALDFPDVDVVGDVFDVIKCISDQSVSGIYSYHFFEHISDFEALFSETMRVLSPGGKLKIVVPHFSNPFYYSDVTHKTTFGLYTMSYFCDDNIFKRAVPRYMRDFSSELNSVDLIFKSHPPRYIRHFFKKAFGFIVNVNSFTKETYEENFTWMFPCYEIKFVISKKLNI